VTESDATLLFLHAHPDDECILTGATMATAAALGFRVLVAYGTRGDAGETNKDLGGETLGDRRTREALAACEVLGTHRVEWLGYSDSGMVDTETTKHPDAFCNADLDEATGRLVGHFAGERIDAIVGYDRNGTYGHPDHHQVHRLAHHAADALGAPWVFDATYDREYLASLDETGYGEIDEAFASARAELTHYCESAGALLTKLDAISHHLSQVPDEWDTDEPDVAGFARRFGTEWFIAHEQSSEALWTPLDHLFAPKHTWSGTPPLATS
jgi:LmbE family N-acetylglucosaminyl deacetylase